MMKLVALSLLFAVMALLLRSFGFRGAAVFTALAVAAILSLATSEVRELLRFIDDGELFDEVALTYASDIARLVGVGYLFGICADVCTELGEGGIAKAVTVAGRIEILLLASPYFVKILGLAEELLS